MSSRAEEVGIGEVEDGVSIAISAMLMCAITFFMGLFYLVNHSRELVRMRAWQSISSTVSVFGSILIFRSGKDLLTLVVPVMLRESVVMTMSLAFLQTCFWYYLMMYALGFAVQAAVDLDADSTVKHLLCVQLCTTFGTLFSHVTGFAALNMWARLQQLPPFNSSPSMTWSAFGVTSVVTFAYVYLADCLYHSLSNRVRKVCPIGVLVWQDYFYEATYDICGVCWGFLIVQALRFSICGTLPDLEGNDKIVHTPGEAWLLLLIGLAASVWKVALFVVKPCPVETSRQKLGAHGFHKWYFVYESIFESALSMTSAWMLMWATSTWLEILYGFGSNMLGEVVRSMVCSTWCFVLIIAMAYGQDLISEEKKQLYNEFVAQITPSIGILIGFSWESCFDKAVEVANVAIFLPVAGEYSDIGKLVLSVIVAVIVMPAWSWYIVPNVVELEEGEKDEWRNDVLAHHERMVALGMPGFKPLQGDEESFIADRVREVEEQLLHLKTPEEKYRMLKKLLA